MTNAGVPLGSILGPTLWNVMHDGVLFLKLPRGFVDDIASVVVGDSEIGSSKSHQVTLRRIDLSVY